MTLLDQLAYERCHNFSEMMRSIAFLAHAICLLDLCRSQPTADQALNARSDAMALVAMAKAIPKLQTLTAGGGVTPWATTFSRLYTDLSFAPEWCSFVGVICGEDTSSTKFRRVTDLELSYLDLEGTLPVLSQLGEMTRIDIGYNYLRGSIPPSISGFTKLRSLSLHGNQLNGTIPSTIGSITNMSILILSENKLSGTIPSTLCGLTNLGYLDLRSNKLTGTMPSALGGLTNLRTLHIYDNKELSGTIPSSLSYLTNLQTLILFGNQLSGVIPSTISLLTNILKLDFSTNKLSGNIPSSLSSLTKLADFYARDNQLIGTIPVLNQPSLSTVDLSTNYLTMRKLTEVPLSTFSAKALRFGVLLRENCLKFRNPTTPLQNVDATRCKAPSASPTLKISTEAPSLSPTKPPTALLSMTPSTKPTSTYTPTCPSRPIKTKSPTCPSVASPTKVPTCKRPKSRRKPSKSPKTPSPLPSPPLLHANRTEPSRPDQAGHLTCIPSHTSVWKRRAHVNEQPLHRLSVFLLRAGMQAASLVAVTTEAHVTD